MRINLFDSIRGLYHFELDNLSTDVHFHPAIEIIRAKKGDFTIEAAGGIFSNIRFIIINTIVSHRVVQIRGEVEILMLESNPDTFFQILQSFQLQLQNGVYTESVLSDKQQIFDFLFQYYSNNTVKPSLDPRIETCFHYFNEVGANYDDMIGVLKARLFLSESRLSHYFKAKTGLSLKKYLVWSRLKKAFQAVVDQKITLQEAALQSGFYDQAHLCRTFRQMLGVNPSHVYNSRTLQD